jgi:hypothetical protein
MKCLSRSKEVKNDDIKFAYGSQCNFYKKSGSIREYVFLSSSSARRLRFGAIRPFKGYLE